MKCPACDHQLSTIKAGDIDLDVCRDHCGGIWFDFKELKKFDEPHEFNVDQLVKAERHSVELDRSKLRHCPKCANEVLCKRFFDIHAQVQVDQCLVCSGIFLDAGELAAIRGQYKTEAERQKAADAYIDTHLKSHYSAMEKATKQEIEQMMMTAAARNGRGLMLFSRALRRIWN